MSRKLLPPDLTGKALHDYLVKNEARIFQAKKAETKKADNIHYVPLFIDAQGRLVDKATADGASVDPTKLNLTVVINTTNWYDSHGDVHIPGLWKKSLADNRKAGFYLLDSHQYFFEKVIIDACQAQALQLSWKDVGVNLKGVTEALVFSGVAEQDRNPYMFDQYQKKRVKQHSVGMRYVKLVTCINDDDYPVQKENWDKYFPMIANPEDLGSDDWFWAILEAKVIEGSAVLFGSNPITPTMESELLGTKSEPPTGTRNAPPAASLMDAIKQVVVCGNCLHIFQLEGTTSGKCPGCGQYCSTNSTRAEANVTLADIANVKIF